MTQLSELFLAGNEAARVRGVRPMPLELVEPARETTVRYTLMHACSPVYKGREFMGYAWAEVKLRVSVLKLPNHMSNQVSLSQSCDHTE